MKFICSLCVLLFLLTNCKQTETVIPKQTFADDLNFLKKYHKDLIVLGDSMGAQVIITPAYQARVMTSTT